MADQTQSTEQVRVEVTLTIDGDWRSDPLKLIRGIREGSRNLDRYLRKAVKAARKNGMSWDQIGEAYGVSRQAAWERFSTD